MKKIIALPLLGFALLTASASVAFACDNGNCNIADRGGSRTGC